jgi:hypothetical protein
MSSAEAGLRVLGDMPRSYLVFGDIEGKLDVGFYRQWASGFLMAYRSFFSTHKRRRS